MLPGAVRGCGTLRRLRRSSLPAVVPDEPHQRGDSHLLEVNCLANIANAVLSGRMGTPDYQSKVRLGWLLCLDASSCCRAALPRNHPAWLPCCAPQGAPQLRAQSQEKVRNADARGTAPSSRASASRRLASPHLLAPSARPPLRCCA